MKTVMAVSGGKIMLKRIRIADNFFTRLRGLMYSKTLEPGTGMLIRPCNQVHTFGMRYDIDVVFLSKKGEVLHIESAIKPRHVSPYISKCWQVLELPSGECAKWDMKENGYIAFC